MRRFGKRLPDLFRRVAQFSNENERPLLAILLYLRPVGRARRVLLAIHHLLLLTSACIIRSTSALPALQLRYLNEVAASVIQLRNSRAGHVSRRHRELGAEGLDPLVVTFDV